MIMIGAECHANQFLFYPSIFFLGILSLFALC